MQTHPTASRWIVITGVTKGLGRAMAEEFIQQGHRVCGCGRSARLIEELTRRYGEAHDFAAVDIADGAQIADWADRLLAEKGAPDLLINNAALINQRAPLWEVPETEWRAMLDVNITGTFLTIRHFLPAMQQRGTGVIVNFSSGWGRSTSPHVAPYCTTKWAIEGLSKACAQDVSAGLAVVAYSPGIIDTAMLRTCFGDDAAAHEKPETWARRHVPALLALGPNDNGRSI